MITKAGLTRGEQLRETSVFLFLIAPSMVFSFFAIRQGALTFEVTAWAIVLRDLGLVALVAFFLWRNGEAQSQAGWSVQTGWNEVLMGVIMFAILSSASGLLDQLLRSAGLSGPSTPLPKFLEAKGAWEYVLATVLVVVVAVAEETMFRGYLILRLSGITGSTALAVALSSVIFALGHGYEGTAGVFTVGFMGLVFALVYVWRKSLVAPVVMHFLQDFIAIVLLPLLSHK
jgi:membrane protease YdiL (CAAX protease family)